MRTNSSLSLRGKFKVYFFITIASILFTIGIQAFLQVVIIFKSGIASFAAVPTFIFNDPNFDLKPFISLIYLLLNVPLIIYYWNKNSKKFTYRSIYFLITQAVFGAIFLIPEISHWVQNPMNVHIPSPSKELRDLQWPIILYAVIGGFLSGVGTGIAWKYGGSSGGTDIIIYYWTAKKKMDVGKGMMITSLLFLTISFIITISLEKNVREYWLTTLIGSIAYMIVSIRIVNLIFPKYQKVSFQIVSSKQKEITKFLKDSGYVHSWKLHPFESGFDHKQKIEITTTLYRLEVRDFISKLYEIDKKIWIQTLPVLNVYGNMNSNIVDNLYH